MTAHTYNEFSIVIFSEVDDKGKPHYWYEISGGGLDAPLETNERFDQATTALDVAKDFIDEHLA